MEGRHLHENTIFKNLGALLQKTITATLLWIMKVTYLFVDFSDQNCVASVQCHTNIIDWHFPYLPPYLISYSFTSATADSKLIRLSFPATTPHISRVFIVFFVVILFLFILFSTFSFSFPLSLC